MTMQLTDLADRPRQFRFYPRVCRVGFLEEVVFLRERLLEDYQFCFQLQGSPGATTVNIDGRDYQADFPRILIKRKGEVHRVDVPGRVSSVYFVYPPEAPFDDWIPRDLVLFSLEFTPALQALSRRIIDFAASPVVSGSTYFSNPPSPFRLLRSSGQILLGIHARSFADAPLRRQSPGPSGGSSG